jgi:hypothetical protein
MKRQIPKDVMEARRAMNEYGKVLAARKAAKTPEEREQEKAYHEGFNADISRSYKLSGWTISRLIS